MGKSGSKLHIVRTERVEIPHNLVAQPTPLVGREREVEAVCALLRERHVRLLTLAGPGGVGKTRLALQVAEELLGAFEDGVYLVELAAVTSPELVVAVVARVLELREAAGRPLRSTMKEHLRDKRMLLVLDNFEQVLAAGNVLSELLAECRHLRVLVTSRAALRLRAEQLFVVPPLALPGVGMHLGVEALAQYGAVALFVDRARAVNPGFKLTHGNASDVVEICRSVDSLPLAIELVAAHARLLPPRAILERLGHLLRLLTRGAHDAPARHQAMRNTIEWSYNLLSDRERRLFRRMSVFVGGGALKAVEAVCQVRRAEGGVRNEDSATGIPHSEFQNPQSLDVLEDAETLVDKSLVRQLGDAEDDVRLGMLETVREYALERLEESGEAEEIRRRFAEYYLALAQEVGPKLRLTATFELWLGRLWGDYDNFRTVVEWLLARAESEAIEGAQKEGAADEALHLLVALHFFLVRRAPYGEVRKWFQRALAQTGPQPTGIKVRALGIAGTLALQLGDREESKALVEAALALARELGDRLLIASTQRRLSGTKRALGDFEGARSCSEAALEIFRELGLGEDIAGELNNLGYNALCQGDYEKAEELCQEALSLFRAAGHIGGVMVVSNTIGHIERCRCNFPAAREAFIEALRITEQTKSRRLAAEALAGFAGAIMAEAAAEITEQQSRHPASAPQGAYRVAQATRLLGSVATLLNTTRTTLTEFEQSDYHNSISTAGKLLDKNVFDAAWEEGQAMTPDQAYALAMEQYQAVKKKVPEGTGARGVQAFPGGLTARQCEVAALVAQGLSNKAIGERLVMSERTAEMHVGHALRKLGLASRAQLAAWAVQHGVAPLG